MNGKIVTCLWFDHGVRRGKPRNSTPPRFLTAMSDRRFKPRPIIPAGKQGSELTVES